MVNGWLRKTVSEHSQADTPRLTAQATGRSHFYKCQREWSQRSGGNCYDRELTKPKDGNIFGHRLSGLGTIWKTVARHLSRTSWGQIGSCSTYSEMLGS